MPREFCSRWIFLQDMLPLQELIASFLCAMSGSSLICCEWRIVGADNNILTIDSRVCKQPQRRNPTEHYVAQILSRRVTLIQYGDGSKSADRHKPRRRQRLRHVPRHPPDYARIPARAFMIITLAAARSGSQNKVSTFSTFPTRRCRFQLAACEFIATLRRRSSAELFALLRRGAAGEDMQLTARHGARGTRYA